MGHLHMFNAALFLFSNVEKALCFQKKGRELLVVKIKIYIEREK